MDGRTGTRNHLCDARRDALRLKIRLITGLGRLLGAITEHPPPGRNRVTRHAGMANGPSRLRRTPAPASTPQLGEQPDGTHIWKVQVACMEMENLIDLQAFFPKEITINAGDAIFFEFPTPPGFIP
jgi:hypothetical protein